MPRGKGEVFQFVKTEPLQPQRLFILKVSLRLHFIDPREPTHLRQVTHDTQYLKEGGELTQPTSHLQETLFLHQVLMQRRY